MKKVLKVPVKKGIEQMCYKLKCYYSLDDNLRFATGTNNFVYKDYNENNSPPHLPRPSFFP